MLQILERLATLTLIFTFGYLLGQLIVLYMVSHGYAQ